ncbi:MAG: lysophospholipid acyltransferase family protein [Desulfobaccales bacterium]
MSPRFSFPWNSQMSLSKFLQMNWNPWIFRFLPFGVSQWVIRTLGRLYYLVNRREQALIQETISLVFRGKIAAGQVRSKIRAAFQGIFDHYHEKLFVGYSNFTKLKDFLRKQVSFQGLEKLQAALSAGRGVILVTGHFGAVEFLPGALTVNGFPTSMICRFQSTRLREAQGRHSQWIGLDLIESDRGQGLWAALQALKAGRILIIECDEFESWRPDSRRVVHFLRHRLPQDRTLELLHRRSGAPVVTALLQRDGHRRYTCQLTSVGEAAPVNLPISDRCLEILENAVQAHPEQWYQWKEFGKMIKTYREVGYDHQEGGYLAPEPAISLPDQA